MTFVYLDISIGTKPHGRIVIELFDTDAPNTCQNFKTLCQSKKFKSTYFHRIIKNFLVQAGDTNITKSSSDNLKYPYIDIIGKGGVSIYGDETNPRGFFKDENLIPIDKSFLVCTGNSNKPDTNTSQFFITTSPSPHLNGKHSVFGKVVYGKSIVREIEKVNVISNKRSDPDAWIPVESEKVVIDDCGIWQKGDDLPNYNSCYDQIGGDIYEEYPDDNEIEGLDFEKPEISYKVVSIIKGSATLLFKKKELNEAFMKYRKALRYCNELIPDESKEEMFKQFQEIKKTLFLNLSLVSLQLGKYNECIDYCGYLLQMSDVKLTDVQASKTFYRLGKAYIGLRKYETALETLRKGVIVSPNDVTIQKELDAVEKLVNDAKKEEKARYAKFFN